MRAWMLHKMVSLDEQPSPLVLQNIPNPRPVQHEILVEVSVCGICHTELDEIEGRTPPENLPMILGHQVVGRVSSLGKAVTRFKIGDRVGIGWIYSSCGSCEYCRTGNDNLCRDFKATGQDRPGGYADFMTVPENYAFHIPDIFQDEQAAPLLCAGAIGYRSLRLTGLTDGQRLGLTGFGASGHLVLMLTRFQYPHSDIYVFARSTKERQFALELGAAWAGDTMDTPPRFCHAIIDTTPVWKPIVEALRCLEPGGRLVVNAIRKESVDQDYLLKLDYPEHLWMEKEIKSVANVSRRDIAEFLGIAAEIPIQPEVQIYPFLSVNEALMDLKQSRIRGAKVLKVH
ncbi:zinc-dependent alcohol dehydrogenase family protein [bacterium]|nr:zinc-dependent alcohol dehydrogenase family protein [bacterium]